MRIPVLLAFSLAAVLMCLDSESRAAERDEAIKDIRALTAKINSYSAESEIVANLGGIPMNYRGSTKRKGSMSESRTIIDMMGQKSSIRSVIGRDGTLWMELEADGEKQVFKLGGTDQVDMLAKGSSGDLGMSMMGFPRDLRQTIDQYTRTYELKLDRKDNLDGVEIYVLKGNLLPEIRKKYPDIGLKSDIGLACMMMGIADTVSIFIATADGLPRKVILGDREHKPWLTTTYKNIVVNAPIDDSMFAYTPPPGVKVEDARDESNADSKR